MKRILVAVLVMSLLLLVVGPAFAAHKPNHNPNQSGGPSGDPPPSCSDTKGRPGQQNKHCYPGGTSSSNSSGQKASFATQAPESGGLTVGTATMIAMGALGALLLVRRRWVFKTARH